MFGIYVIVWHIFGIFYEFGIFLNKAWHFFAFGDMLTVLISFSQCCSKAKDLKVEAKAKDLKIFSRPRTHKPRPRTCKSRPRT